MFGRKRKQTRTTIQDLFSLAFSEASVFAFFWIAVQIWQSSPDSDKDRKAILLKAGARSNFLFQGPVSVEHFHKLDLAREEEQALDALSTDDRLRSLVMQAYGMMEQLENPDPRLTERLMALYGAEYSEPPDLNTFRTLFANMKREFEPVRAQMFSDPLFKSDEVQTAISGKSSNKAAALRRELDRARTLASLLFTKRLHMEGAGSRDEWSDKMNKGIIQAYLVFGRDIPRECACLVDLIGEEAAAMEALRTNSLLRSLVVQSQRMTAVMKYMETGDTAWGMESCILEEFGKDIPKAPTNTSFFKLLRRVEKELAPFKKELRAVDARLT